MRKTSLAILILILFFLGGCQSVTLTISYSDDEPIQMEMENDTLKILQLTDLHLNAYFISDDQKTLDCISTLVQSDNFDLVVITGDMTLSISALNAFTTLVNRMESLQVPWTFSFGNHESENNVSADFLGKITDTEYLKFKTGPNLEDGGCGIFRIVFTQETVPFYTLYLFDSYLEVDGNNESKISSAQVEWYESHVTQDLTDSIAFTHIPLIQYENPVDYTGIFEEDKVYSQSEDTGLFAAMVEHQKTVGFFSGHDHLNDYSFVRDGIYLAYGRVTGYNDYGYLDKGGRVVEINAQGEMSSYIILEKDLG